MGGPRRRGGTPVGRDPLARPEEAFRRLYAYVAYRIGPGPDAEDVVSETVERALRYRDSYDAGKGSPGAWLIGIASRVLADNARVRAAEVPLEETDDLRSVDDIAPRLAESLTLAAAVSSLDDRSRELIALRYGADLKAREIAALLDERTNTVEVALHRALARLRLALEAEPDVRPGPRTVPLESSS